MFFAVDALALALKEERAMYFASSRWVGVGTEAQTASSRVGTF
jgi:hypothetical protein